MTPDGSTSPNPSTRHAPPGSAKRTMNRFRMSHHSGLSNAGSSRSSPPQPTRRNRFHMLHHSGLLSSSRLPSSTRRKRNENGPLTVADQSTDATDANENQLDDLLPVPVAATSCKSAKDIALESSTSENADCSCDASDNALIHESPQPRMAIIDSLLFSESNDYQNEQSEGTRLLLEEGSSSNGHKTDDCPICFCKMHSSDLTHPLQCPTGTCNFNFCRTCVENLIVSSKDDYQLASDGNLHVKVHLRCPSCRSDLSSSIRDTVLLRKADYVQDSTNADILTDSERRMKSVLDCCDVQDALHTAQLREDRSFTPTWLHTDPVSHVNRDSEISAILLHTSSHDEGHAHVELDIENDSEFILVKTRTRHSRNRSSIYQLVDESKKVPARHRAKRSIQRAAAVIRHRVGHRSASNDEHVDTSRHSLRQSLRLRRGERQGHTIEQ